MTGILPTLVTVGSTTPTTVPYAPATPIIVPDAPVSTALLAHVDIVLAEPTPEPLIPKPIEEVPMQQSGVDSQLGGLYITNMQTQMKVMYLFVVWTQ